MKKTFSSLFLFLMAQIVLGQSPGDTIVVETFNYSQTYGINQWSPGIRDTIIDFSVLPNVSYEKVLMKYNIRCKNGNVSTGTNTDFGCGEWDASCNTYLHDPSRIDSVKATHPDYTVSGYSGATFDYTSQPTYDFFQYTQDPGSLDSIVAENQYVVTSGTSTVDEALKGTNHSGKTQYLFTASELTTAGMSSGDIDGFLLNALDSGDIHFLRVNIKGTTANVLDVNNPETDGFTEVYFSNYTFQTGSNRIQFSTAYNWNGTDNIIVELSFTNTITDTDIQLEGAAVSGQAIYVNNGYSINLAANTHISVPITAMSTINNEITVSFWAYGAPDLLPANTSIIHANNLDGERSLNIHLPWSNSRVYFDCGNIGNGYDRIDKEAIDTELEGQWNHWAATKNAVTGEMKLYLNGVLWHSGTNLTEPIELAEMIIGKSNALGNNYKGYIDELRIWDVSLSSTDIQNWMNRPVDSSHPQYANLVAYYKMDEGAGVDIDDVANSAIATISNTNVWRFERGIHLSRGFQEATNRPNITFFEGTYNYTSNPTVVTDSIQLTPNIIQYYSVNTNGGTLLDDEIVTTSQLTVWNAIPQNIYDAETGALLSTINVAIENTTSPVVDMTYYRRYPAKIEIMSFVTPYGINLDLGPKGKTWTFDMTDYLPIFNGSKRMTIERGGQWMEDMDIKFLFIVGTPPRDVIDFQQIWRPESRGYLSIMDDSYFPPKEMPLESNGEYFKVRTAITGHGQQGEFIPRQHYINLNSGVQQFDWTVWKECADNPIYPQGGTWVYDRAGWCPGAPTDVEHIDITPYVTAGQSVTIDYGVSTASGTSNYIVNSQLITYGAINHTLDAAIVEVREPSDRVEFTRFNSICHEPKITIQNTGSTALTSLEIEYWINNASQLTTYQWTGNLEFLETEIVTLPSWDNLWSTLQADNNKFHVEIKNPNGGTDEYEYNNHYVSSFEIPDVWPLSFVIQFKTNQAPEENSYDIRDYQGNVVFERSNMDANTQYRDTMDLGYGCYTFNVYDTDDDGISWWANNDGNGSIRIRRTDSPLSIKAFEGDFGDNIHFNFTTGAPLDLEDIEPVDIVDIYPNPVSSELTVTINGLKELVEVTFFNLHGQLVKSSKVKTVNGFYKGQMSIEKLPKGLYIVRISDGYTIKELKVAKE
jgi:hypothetical protein